MYSVFSLFISLAVIGLVSLTLIGTIELLILTVAALFYKRPQMLAAQVTTLPRLAVVIPAHNEEQGITACLHNLAHAKDATTHCALIVIADNCTDATAALAAQAGARVLVRHNLELRGKGYALDYAFKHLLSEDFDGFLVIDADSCVDVGLFHQVQLAFARGQRAVQGYYRVSNAHASKRARLQNIAQLAFNDVRLLGREQLKLSVGILGNGFALSRELLEQVPYEAGSIAEDMEYHLRLVCAGYKIEFLSWVGVWADTPNQIDNAAVQRSRWEGGRLRLIIEQAPRLAQLVCTGRKDLLEPLAELLLLPLTYHVALLLLTLLFPVAWAQYYALAALGLVSAHVLFAIRVGGGGWQAFTTLLSAPFYLLWKLVLLPSIWRNAKRSALWQRTGRELS